MAILVTGAAKRIGASIARQLAAAGHHVIVHANQSVDEGRILAKEIGGDLVTGDLMAADGADAVYQAANQCQDVDHVVNNASQFPRSTIRAVTNDEWQTMLHLHAWIPLRFMQLHAGRQSVTNLLDTRIAASDPQHFAYIHSKRMLHELTLSGARELAPTRVNAVAPGAVLPPTDGGSMEDAVAATVLKKPATPEEIGQSVQFLIESPSVTGQVLFVDGGRHLGRWHR